MIQNEVMTLHYTNDSLINGKPAIHSSSWLSDTSQVAALIRDVVPHDMRPGMLRQISYLPTANSVTGAATAPVMLTVYIPIRLDIEDV